MKNTLIYDEINSVKNYLEEISKIPLLTKEEEQKLGLLLLRDDKEARNKLVESNLRLVVHIAKKYMGRGLEFCDLIEEGNLALREAITNYDVRKGVSVCSYVGKFIDGCLKSAVAEKSRNIKIGKTYYYFLCKILRVRNEMYSKLRRYPTDDEVANEIGITPKLVNSLLKYKDDTVSLSEMIMLEDDELELESLIIDPDVDVLEEVMKKELKKEMNSLFNHQALTTKEKEVLYNRYKLNLKFEEIGIMYGKTRQAIDRTEKRALDKLRSLIDVDEMSLYLDYPEKGKEFVKAKTL